MRKIFLGVLMCMVSWTIYAEEYYIEGKITAHRVPIGNGKYKAKFVLNNPKGNGITFDPVPQVEEDSVESLPAGTKMFVFKNAQTDCPKGFSKLNFERYLEETGEWQRDGEVRQGEYFGSKTSWTTIVLVLDHTTSLLPDPKDKNARNGLEDMKNAAVKFVNKIVKSPDYVNGSVHLGIVAFAAETETLPIAPLTSSNATKYIDFIENLKPRNNTYLYSAMDKAIKMFESYNPFISINGNKRWENCRGVSLITFTDGFDNGSINVEENIMSSGEYFDHLNTNRMHARIGAPYNAKYRYTIDSHVIFVKGSDIKNEASIYVDKLKALASDPNSQFYRVQNTSELEEQFLKILNKLTVRWIDLKCYIPQHTGLVRWVLDCGEPEPKPEPVVEKPKKEKKCVHQLGVILGANEGLTYKVFVPAKKFAFQWDFGFNVVTQSLDVLTTNFMYQNSIRQGKKSNFYLYAGAGFLVGSALGYEYWSYWNGENYVEKYQHHNGGAKLGFNAIVGLEWMFKKSFALSLDYRPGIDFIEYSEIFYFNYLNLNLGLRWYF